MMCVEKVALLTSFLCEVFKAPGGSTRREAMLVLTRKVGEEIIIDEEIRITIIGIRDNQVRLGITAPREKVVDRREIYERRRRPWLWPGEGRRST
jgi:carbon storage regulator